MIYTHPEFTCALWSITAPHLPNVRFLGLCSSTWSWVPGRGCQAVAAALSFSAVYFTAGILFISVCLYRNVLFPFQPPAVISKDCSHCHFIICLLLLTLDKWPFKNKRSSHFLYNLYAFIYRHTRVCVLSLYSSYLQENSGGITA